MTVEDAGTKRLVSCLRGFVTNSKGKLTVCFVNSTGKAGVILILIQAWIFQAVVSLLLREGTLLWWSSLSYSFQPTISLDICGFCVSQGKGIEKLNKFTNLLCLDFNSLLICTIASNSKHVISPCLLKRVVKISKERFDQFNNFAARLSWGTVVASLQDLLSFVCFCANCLNFLCVDM